MIRMRTEVCAFLFAVSMGALLHAQSVDMLTGRVLDASGAAVPNAQVRVEIAGSATTVEGQTDGDGRFAVAVMADAPPTVVVPVPGLAPSFTPVPAGTRTVEVTLQAAPLFE